MGFGEAERAEELEDGEGFLEGFNIVVMGGDGEGSLRTDIEGLNEVIMEKRVGRFWRFFERGGGEER